MLWDLRWHNVASLHVYCTWFFFLIVTFFIFLSLLFNSSIIFRTYKTGHWWSNWFIVVIKGLLSYGRSGIIQLWSSAANLFFTVIKLLFHDGAFCKVCHCWAFRHILLSSLEIRPVVTISFHLFNPLLKTFLFLHKLLDLKQRVFTCIFFKDSKPLP